jgi:HSP20 family molecular chaperone IbpA
MGYIQDLEIELQNRLADLEEDRQKELIRFVKEKIVESYRNGIMSVKMVKAGKEAERKTRKFSKG